MRAGPGSSIVPSAVKKKVKKKNTPVNLPCMYQYCIIEFVTHCWCLIAG